MSENGTGGIPMGREAVPRQGADREGAWPERAMIWCSGVRGEEEEWLDYELSLIHI